MSGRYIPDVIIVSVIYCVPVFIPNIDQKVNKRRDLRHDSPSVIIDNHYKHFGMYLGLLVFLWLSGSKFQSVFHSALTSIPYHGFSALR